MLRLLLRPRRFDAYTFLPHWSSTRWSAHDIPSEHPHCRAGDIAEGQVVRVAWDDEGARFFVGGELRFKKVAWGGAPDRFLPPPCSRRPRAWSSPRRLCIPSLG